MASHTSFDVRRNWAQQATLPGDHEAQKGNLNVLGRNRSWRWDGDKESLWKTPRVQLISRGMTLDEVGSVNGRRQGLLFAGSPGLDR